MNRLLPAILAVAMCAATGLRAEDARIAGKWQMSVETPHGLVQGQLEIRQDGAKVTGTYETEQMGSMPMAGKVDGKTVAFTLQVPGGDMTVALNGAVDGDKMSGTMQPHGSAWNATRQSAAPKAVLGTVTEFKIASLEIGVQPDHGAPVFLKFGPETQVLRVPPGDRGLDRAQPAAMTDIAPGDRIMVSFVAGLADARRIVVVSSSDIARRNAAERLDWQKRGVSGIVASKSGGEIALEQRTLQGAHTIAIEVGARTIVRRYAPDSVKFSDARPSSIAEIAPGDQLQARGTKSEDGTRVAAEEIVFGTFLTKIGTITAIRPEAGEIQIEDLATRKPLTVRVTRDSRLKMLPDMHATSAGMPAGPDHAPPDSRAEIAKIIERLPAATMDDLKVGSAIVVVSTRGADPDELTAITLLANADFLVQMAAMHGGANENPMEVIGRLHGGVLNGPNGVSLPAMIQ